MIENPPLIQIKKSSSRNRPSIKQIEKFKNIPTGFICDALGGYAALDTKIKPLLVPGKNVEPIVGGKRDKPRMKITEKKKKVR